MRGEQAAAEAHDRLREARERWQDVRQVSAELRQARERNGFGEAMMELFRGAR